MSDSEKISASENVSDSSKDLSELLPEDPFSQTTPEEESTDDNRMLSDFPIKLQNLSTNQIVTISDSEKISASEYMSELLPEDPFDQGTPIPQEESTDENRMFSDFPIKTILDDVFSNEEDPSINPRTPGRKLEENVTASNENMPDIVGPSRSTPTFVCNFRPARYLKFAIEVLSNPEVSCHSCQGSGRIDIDNSGFNITVQNLSNNVLGHLELSPDEFHCTNRLYGKRFSLLALSQELANVVDESTVYLVNRTGTDQLDIRVLLEGTGDTRRFFVELSYNSAVIRKFPDMRLLFTATVPPEACRLMIQNLLQQKEPQVSVDIKDNIATLRAGIEYSWTATYAMIRAYGSRAMEAGENYSTRFQWTNASVAASLQKASEMYDGFVLLFHAEQPKSIILRFYLGDLGYLEFIRECSTTFS